MKTALTLRERAQAAAYDAIVVGAGPNGLAAAITLAEAGMSVLLVEGAETVGGGCRSSSTLTLPGFVHDTCSAIYPLGIGSPAFRRMPLERYGLEWVHADTPLAHPFDDGPAAILERSIDATAEGLGGADGRAWKRRIGGLAPPDWDVLCDTLRHPLKLARYPFGLARFGLPAMRSARALAESWFSGERARGLFAGIAAHSMLPLEQSPSAAFALVLALAGHAVGWPMVRGGAQNLANALAGYFVSLGGEIVASARVSTLDELPEARRAVLLDLFVPELLRVAGDRLPAAYRRRLERFRPGPGTFKIDYALSEPVPWRDPALARAATVHLGGTLEEIAAAERDVLVGGRAAERPYVLVAQQSVFDRTRVPEPTSGAQTLWAYCHLPAGDPVDATAQIEAQIERYAPGFRETVLARHATGPAALAARNPNYDRGDFSGGAMDWPGLLARPVLPTLLSPLPWRVPGSGNLYLCSASTPPGGGVHGMCGYWAACAALGSTNSISGR